MLSMYKHTKRCDTIKIVLFDSVNRFLLNLSDLALNQLIYKKNALTNNVITLTSNE